MVSLAYGFITILKAITVIADTLPAMGVAKRGVSLSKHDRGVIAVVNKPERDDI